MSERPEDLIAFVSQLGGDKALRVEENLGQGFVRLRVAEAERRQAAQDIRCSEDAVVEMLRNARDAGARRIFVATAREGSRRSIVMLDDGSGIPRALWEAVFDARVTSKLDRLKNDRWGVHGRGMALYSIRENALEARVVDSVVQGGTSLRVMVDTEHLAEKADQSSWPTMGTDDEGNTVIERGPHNIIRACCEFALDQQEGCEVFLGSPAEIVATARARVRCHLSAADVMALASLSELPVLERFRLSSDAHELMEVACALGLDISERTAHRVIAGQIRPVRSVAAKLLHGQKTQKRRDVNLSSDRRGLRIAQEDSEHFLNMMEQDFAYLADRYYLTLSGTPRMRVSGTRLVVSFDYEGLD